MKSLFLDIRIGFYLAFRQIRRASFWTTALIIFIMTLTFLNLVVVSGVLVGLIEGSVAQNRIHYTSDVMLSNLNEKDYIENSPFVLNVIKNLPDVEGYSARYLEGGSVEANYQLRTNDKDKPNRAAAQIGGIDPEKEDAITGISDFVIEGSYLTPTDYDKVLIGALLLKKYLPFESPGFSTLDNVEPGTKVRITINGINREVIVKGILKSKVDEIQMRIYFVDTQLRSLLGRDDYNVDEIVLKLKPGADVLKVKEDLIAAGVDKFAKVQTYEDAQPKFLKDIKATFALLGNMISSIGLVVASITIFIVIFINAITRRKFIGILKGIGISARAVEFSYIMQSFLYAISGSAIGLIVLYGLLQPFITAHPINFPFSDGILVAPIVETLVRILILVIITIIAGYVPARMIVRKNTLDSILGR